MHYRCYDIENKKYQIPYSYRPSRTVWNDSAVEWNSVPDGNVVAFKTHLLQRGGGESRFETDYHARQVTATRLTPGPIHSPINRYRRLMGIITKYRVILSLEAPNYCLCIQSNSAGFSFVNTGKLVHLKHARWHFERNLVKDVHRWSVASGNWLKS